MTSIIPTNESNSISKSTDISVVDKTINWILNVGIQGLGALPSAEEVAKDHLRKCGDVEKAIASIIKWKTAYAGGSGFITGLGGIIALPVTLPVGLAASYAIAANQAAAIAYLRGYEVHSDQVRTMILLCLVGEVGEDLLKGAGIAIGTKATHHAIMHKIPKSLLGEVNRRVGFKLIAKTNEKAAIRLIKIVPIVGGIVGGAFDGAFVRACGNIARKTFSSIGN